MSSSPAPRTSTVEWSDPDRHAGREALLDVADLGAEFVTERGWVRVVDGVSFRIGAGEILGLVGESGSGKTVTGLSIMRLIPNPPGRIAGGNVRFAGRSLLDLREAEMRNVRGADIAMVFQEPLKSLNPAFTVGEQIAEVVRRHAGVSRRAAWQRAIECLDLVRIPNARLRSREYPHQFSGGMRQRVMLAIALACEPKLLIADEPTTALDVTIQAQILQLLMDLRAQLRMAVLFITHDLGVVAEICDSVVVMYGGQVVEAASGDELFEAPLHPYTSGLMRAMPQLGPREGRLATIPGRVAEPWELPDGCRFAPRCPHVGPECEEQAIPLIDRSGRSARCIRLDELDREGQR